MTIKIRTLKERTIDGLGNAKGQWPAIRREAGVSYSWLCKLAQNQFPDASSDKIERVYRALVRRGLVEPQVNFTDAA